MSDIAEYQAKQKLFSREIFGKLSAIYLGKLGGKVIVVQENYLGLQSEF